MTDVSRALAQIEAIHDQLARSGVYRGWRSLPVAASGIMGLAAAAWQSATPAPLEPVAFTASWSVVAIVAIAIGCSEIAWHFVVHATSTDRRRTRLVLGQFLPALVAAALITAAFIHASPDLVALLPGVWALCFGVAIFSAHPYLPGSSALIAAYYWIVGVGLLWTSTGHGTPSPWAVGGTFGVGQIASAAILYFSLERPASREDDQTVNPSDEV